MGPIGCPEAWVGNYHYSLLNSPEEHSFQLLRGGSLKSRTIYLVTLKLQASEQPPLATSPHPVDPSARSANLSTCQNHALEYKLQYISCSIMPYSVVKTAIFGTCVFGGAKFDRQQERRLNPLTFIVLFIFLCTNTRNIPVVFPSSDFPNYCTINPPEFSSILSFDLPTVVH